MTPISPFVIALMLATTCAAVFAGSARSDCAGSKAREAQMDNTTGQILIRFEDGTTEAEAARIIARIGAQEIDRMMDGKIYLVEIPYPSAQGDIIDALSSTAGVVYAEPNQAMSIPEPPEGSDAGDGQGKLIPLPKVD